MWPIVYLNAQRGILGAWLLGGLFFFNACQSTSSHQNYEPGASNIRNLPQLLPLPPELSEYPYFEIWDSVSDRSWVAQRWDDDNAVFLAEFSMEERQKFHFQFKPIKTDPACMVNVESLDSSLLVRVGEKKVLQYNIGSTLPTGVPEVYRRTGYIHPLYGPDGQTITDHYPIGHLHQDGIFFSWVNTRFKEKKIDFWNLAEETGKVVHLEVLDTLSGPVFARIKVKLQFLSFAGPALEEEWIIHIFNNQDPFIIDFDSVQRCATADTLYLDKYHYGGMAFRGSREWNPIDSLAFTNDMKVLTSEGIEREGSNHSRPMWVAGYGLIEGKASGVAFLSAPFNFRAPQFIRVHPEEPYFCFPPVVEEGFTIEPGESYESRYQIIAFSGIPDKKRLDRLWSAFTTIP